jgi:hypothetical protein
MARFVMAGGSGMGAVWFVVVRYGSWGMFWTGLVSRGAIRSGMAGVASLGRVCFCLDRCVSACFGMAGEVCYGTLG